MQITLLTANVRITCLVILIFCYISTRAQQAIDTIAQTEKHTDSVSYEEKVNLLMISAGFASNKTNMKNFKDEKTPYLMSDVSFYSKSGIYAALSYTNYIDTSINTYETELQIGYQNTFFKIFHVDFYYGWHHFEGVKLYEGIDYDHILNLSNGVEISFLHFDIDSYISFGESNNYFLDLSSGFTLDIENLIVKEDMVYINPMVSISYGTDYWLYDDFGEFRKRHIHRYLQAHDYAANQFEYQSLSFYIPIIYSIGDFSISSGWFYSIPSGKFKALNWGNQSGFIVSLVYTPDIF